MTKLTIANSASYSATVSLLDFARSISIDWGQMDKFVPKLERLTYVDYVEDRHQFWIRLELDTGRAETAEKRINDTLAKVERILRKHTKKEAA